MSVISSWVIQTQIITDGE